MLQTVSVTAFTFSELLRENQQLVTLRPLPPTRLGLNSLWQLSHAHIFKSPQKDYI